MLLTGGPANPAGPGDPVSPLSPWKATTKSQCRQVKTASQVLSPAHRARILWQPYINYSLCAAASSTRPILIWNKSFPCPPQITIQIMEGHKNYSRDSLLQKKKHLSVPFFLILMLYNHRDTYGSTTGTRSSRRTSGTSFTLLKTQEPIEHTSRS